MRRLITASALALLALVLAPAALAQQAPAEPPDGVADERFATDETRDLSRQINEAEARYERNEQRIDTLTENMEMGDERDRLMAENAEMDDSNPELREDLVDARYEAIEAPEEGGETRVAALETKEDALAALSDYSGEVYGDSLLSEDVDKTEEIEAELEATEAELEAAEEEAEQRNQDQAAAAPGGDSGGSGGGGDDGGSGGSPAPEPGGIGPFGPIVSAGFAGFGLALVFVGVVALMARRRPWTKPANREPREDPDLDDYDGPTVGG